MDFITDFRFAGMDYLSSALCLAAIIFAFGSPFVMRKKES